MIFFSIRIIFNFLDLSSILKPLETLTICSLDGEAGSSLHHYNTGVSSTKRKRVKNETPVNYLANGTPLSCLSLLAVNPLKYLPMLLHHLLSASLTQMSSMGDG